MNSKQSENTKKPHDPNACPVCAGTGEVRLHARDGLTNEWRVMTRQCGACKPPPVFDPPLPVA